jgi:hypothetical protein
MENDVKEEQNAAKLPGGGDTGQNNHCGGCCGGCRGCNRWKNAAAGDELRITITIAAPNSQQGTMIYP